MVSEKVLEPVSEKIGINKVPISVMIIFGTGKKFRYHLTFWVPSQTDAEESKTALKRVSHLLDIKLENNLLLSVV